MTRFNYDGLNNAPPEEVALASFRLLEVLQDYPAPTQAAATAAAFLLLCEQWKVPPQEVFVATKNLLTDDRHGKAPHFNALRLYLQHEITKR